MFTVRRAQIGDCSSIMTLLKELVVYVKSEDEVKIDEETLRRDGFGSHKLFHCFVAELDKDMIGFILCYYTFTSYVGKGVYVEDFYVKPDHRGKGVGTSLWNTAVQDALDNNCKQMDWAVNGWNTTAVEFYKRKGGTNITEKEQVHVYKLTEDGMRMTTHRK